MRALRLSAATAALVGLLLTSCSSGDPGSTSAEADDGAPGSVAEVRDVSAGGEGTWPTESGTYPFASEERCADGDGVACPPGLVLAPEESSFAFAADPAAVLGGIGTVLESDRVSVTYRGSMMARREGTNSANPSELMVVTAMDFTNHSDVVREVRFGIPDGMDILARKGSFVDHEQWMGECAYDGVPSQGLLEPGETMTTEFCWHHGGPTGWMEGDPYIRVDGARNGDTAWLGDVAAGYPDGVRDDVRATIELLSDRVDRDPGENGLTAWEERHRQGDDGDGSGADEGAGSAPTQEAATGAPIPEPPPTPSATELPPPPPPTTAPSSPPAATSEAPGGSASAGAAPEPSPEPSEADPEPQPEHSGRLADAAPRLVEEELGVAVPECQTAAPDEGCYALLYETAYESGVRVREAGTAPDTWDVYLLLASDGPAAGGEWQVIERWVPGSGTAPIWAEGF